MGDALRVARHGDVLRITVEKLAPRVPYGVKSVDTIRSFTTQIADYLLERDVKLLIIACNTMAAVAGDVYERMIVRGTIKKEDTREIYRSAVFPTSSFAYAHDLKPELAKKLTDCFFSFRFTPEMTKEFNGDDRFLPITYQKDWAVVRDVAEKSGTPYNKSAYDTEARREADELAKKKAQQPAPAKAP